MTQPAAAPAAPATPAAAPPVAKPAAAKPADASVAQATPKDAQPEKVRVRGYERAAKVKAKLEGETSASSSDSAGESSPDRAVPPQKDSPAESGGERSEAKPQPGPSHDETRAKYAEERARRLAEVARKEREAEAERAQKRQSRTAEQEVEKLRKQIAEYEPYAGAFKKKDVMAMLAIAEREGLSAEDIATSLRSRLTDPAAVAQHQAKTEAERIRDQIREELRAEMRQEFDAERTKTREEREALQRAAHFEHIARERAESHPMTARLLKKHGMEAVARFANEQVLQYLPENYSLEHLHDVMEQYLDWLHGGDSPGSDSPAPGTSHPPKKNGADKPVTTLSNSLAAERSTLTEETPLHQLPLSERTRRLKAKLERE